MHEIWNKRKFCPIWTKTEFLFEFVLCMCNLSDILAALNLIDQCLNIIVYEITDIYIIRFVFFVTICMRFSKELLKRK